MAIREFGGRKMRKDKKVIPVIDCPICGAKDVPLSHEATMQKEGKPDLEIWQCSSCGKVPNIAHDLKIKRYISMKELEELGWQQDVK